MKTAISVASLFFLVLAASPVRASDAHRPDPDQAYVYAEDRIPDFQAQRKPDEGWRLDPTPPSWTRIPLDGKWKVQVTRIGGFVDYLNIDKNFGVETMEEILQPGHDVSGWKTIDVPLPLGEFSGRTNAADPDKPGYVAVYQRSFDAPAFDQKTQGVFLKFHGAGYRTDVWLNGTYLGSQIGKTAPFEFDVTSLLTPGKPASLVVKCVDSRYAMRWANYFTSGLSNPVELQVRNVPFVEGLRLAPDLAGSKVDGRFAFSGTLPSAKAKVVIEEAKSGKKVGETVFEARQGAENAFSVKLDNPRYWSPEDPFLYVCKVQLDGREAGESRFGFRTMEIKADAEGRQHFYLNGKRVYLRMFEFNPDSLVGKSLKGHPIPHDAWSLNNQGRLRENLLAMKFANVNALRPHSADAEVDATLLNLCDELGFIVYLDWTGSEFQRVTPKEDKEGFDSSTGGGQNYRVTMLEKHLPAFERAVTAFHNHPSLCLFSFGNEMYEHLLTGVSYDGIIEKYKEALHRIDLQKRPTSGSAGRPTYKHDAKVDFVDDHQYIGVYYGSYQSVVPYIKNTSGAIKDKFGANIPFINSESGYVADDRIHPDNQRIFGTELKKETFDKDLIIKTITGKNEEQAWARLGLNSGGVRYFYGDLPEFKKRKATLQVKRWLEMFRMNRKYNDGISLNTIPHCVAAYSDPDAWYGVSINPWPEPGKLALMDPIYAFRKAFSPVQAFVGIENYHPLSGASTKAPIMIVNDSSSGAVVDLTVLLRNADGEAVTLLEKTGVAVPQGGDASLPFDLAIPEGYPSGKAVLETYLTQDGKKIAENSYDIHTLAAADRRKEFPDVKLALYDSAGEKFGGLGGKTTKSVLKGLNIPFTAITDFKDLAAYQVVVIGANSLDETVAKSGAEIAAWIAAGGRLLMFEQSYTGAIPWASTDRIYRMGAGSFVEHFVKDHPAFSGIEHGQFTKRRRRRVWRRRGSGRRI
ncbi:MAG: hypothetical protein IAE94_16535, partial [Chthoniobacterales bacterium]|nr:hypothetical protein [Chthoniobacterales bacterium]